MSAAVKASEPAYECWFDGRYGSTPIPDADGGTWHDLDDGETSLIEIDDGRVFLVDDIMRWRAP